MHHTLHFMPKSLRFLEGLVMDFQFIDVPECLSSWKIQGIDLENGHFLYFAAFAEEALFMLYTKFVIVLIVVDQVQHFLWRYWYVLLVNSVVFTNLLMQVIPQYNIISGTCETLCHSETYVINDIHDYRSVFR